MWFLPFVSGRNMPFPQALESFSDLSAPARPVAVHGQSATTWTLRPRHLNKATFIMEALKTALPNFSPPTNMEYHKHGSTFTSPRILTRLLQGTNLLRPGPLPPESMQSTVTRHAEMPATNHLTRPPRTFCWPFRRPAHCRSMRSRTCWLSGLVVAP